MAALTPRLHPGDPVFEGNREATEQALGALAQRLGRARMGGGERYVARHIERGKLLPRERIELLLDPGGWFLELCPLAGDDIDGGRPGAGLIGGVGLVEGTEVLITANESTLQGGAINEWAVKKTNRLAEVALENRLPSVSLIESAGADLMNQASIFIPGGQGFRDLTRRSQQGLPSVCLVFGSSTAGGAYIPGMSDHVVMVRGQAQAYLAGPPLVKMAIGEEVDDETLGGAEMHARQSGLCDHLAEDERDALRIGRQIVRGLRWRKEGPAPAESRPPRHPVQELRGLASPDERRPVPAREILARLLDESEFDEFKALYGPTLVTGLGRLMGYPVGVLANDGILTSEAAQKGAQFIQLCNQRSTPLLFLHNTTGFMVGRAVEQGGIIKHGAKLINAVSNSTVPAITLMTGCSYGAGNYAMMGRAYAPRFLFTWPHHRIAVMGGEQLAGVLDLVKRQAAQARGKPVDEAELAMMKTMLRGKVELESTAVYASARLWDDGIIDPADSRIVLGLALSAAHSAPVRGTTSFGVFRH